MYFDIINTALTSIKKHNLADPKLLNGTVYCIFKIYVCIDNSNSGKDMFSAKIIYVFSWHRCFTSKTHYTKMQTHKDCLYGD